MSYLYIVPLRGDTMVLSDDAHTGKLNAILTSSDNIDKGRLWIRDQPCSQRFYVLKAVEEDLGLVTTFLPFGLRTFPMERAGELLTKVRRKKPCSGFYIGEKGIILSSTREAISWVEAYKNYTFANGDYFGYKLTSEAYRVLDKEMGDINLDNCPEIYVKDMHWQRHNSPINKPVTEETKEYKPAPSPEKPKVCNAPKPPEPQSIVDKIKEEHKANTVAERINEFVFRSLMDKSKNPDYKFILSDAGRSAKIVKDIYILIPSLNIVTYEVIAGIAENILSEEVREYFINSVSALLSSASNISAPEVYDCVVHTTDALEEDGTIGKGWGILGLLKLLTHLLQDCSPHCTKEEMEAKISNFIESGYKSADWTVYDYLTSFELLDTFPYDITREVLPFTDVKELIEKACSGPSDYKDLATAKLGAALMYLDIHPETEKSLLLKSNIRSALFWCKK